MNRTWIGQKRKFTYTELHSATKGFSQNNLLSDHGRKLYKGLLNDQSNVLIWEHPSVSIKEGEFEREVKSLGKIRHENVAMIIGYCSEGQQRMLVYEYVCNGSLNWHLSSKQTVELFSYTSSQIKSEFLISSYSIYNLFLQTKAET